jgi:DNA-binding transcriptional regulator YhcF (GntR family)
VSVLPAASLDGEGPLYRQVYRSIRQGILERRIAPATRLPSSRELADQAGLSRNTVIRAYEQLTAEGYAETRHGAGTFVAAALPEAGPSPARARRRRAATRPVSEYAERAMAAIDPWGASFDIARVASPTARPVARPSCAKRSPPTSPGRAESSARRSRS